MLSKFIFTSLTAAWSEDHLNTITKLNSAFTMSNNRLSVWLVISSNQEYCITYDCI